MVQGGTSTGRTLTDTCYVIDSPEALRFCKVAPPFQTQVKLLAVYPVPFWGLQASAAFQSLPGPMDDRRPGSTPTLKWRHRWAVTSPRARTGRWR